jgi:hypothetical protein
MKAKSVHEVPATERLRRIYADMKLHYGLPKLRASLGEHLQASPSMFKEFHHKIGEHNWFGLMYNQRNSLYGTIFSFFGRTPLIIRGFPKIQYTETSEVYNNECHIEEKVDGTNLILWVFPDGTFMGKTRFSERFDAESGGYEGRHWKDMLDQTGFSENLKKLCKAGYSVAVELFGTDNPGDFIRYTIPISCKVLEIADAKTLHFVDYSTKISLCEKFGLTYPKLIYQGLLSPKKLEELEFKAKELVVEDGMEGFVAKFYDDKVHDVYMGKIKCAEVKEKCWLMSPRSKIPNMFIGKAIRKARESNIPLDSPDALTFVKQELLEDFEQKFVDVSETKITKMLGTCEQKLKQNSIGLDKVYDFFDALVKRGIPITFENKSKVLSISASAPELEGVPANRLYTAFCTYVSTKKPLGEKE